VQPISTIAPSLFVGPRLSRDGRRALVIAQNDVRIYDLETGRESLVTTDKMSGAYAAWSPDETSVAYSSSRTGTGGPMNVWVQNLRDGTARQLTRIDGLSHVDAWSADGRTLLFHHHSAERAVFNLFKVAATPGDDASPQPFTSAPGSQEAAMVSPDGKFVVHTDNLTGRPEVVIRPFETAGTAVPVSAGGGREPFWAKNGEVFYRRTTDDAMMVVKVTTTPSLVVGSAERLFAGTGTNPGGSSRAAYAVTADGQRFLMSTSRTARDSGTSSSVTVLLNWATVLKDRLRQDD
jgi:Tol biopolymer transport system component